MLNTYTLAAPGEHIVALDDDALASIVGGEGWREWIARKVGDLLIDCIFGGLDDLIAAAEEGYQDAR